MSKKDRQLKKAAKQQARDENGILKNDIFLNFKIDQKFHFNEHHKAFVDRAFDENSHILFCDGPAGSSKTYCATYVALSMLKEKRIDEVIYIRSIVESAMRKLGSLPGEVDEKFKPWSLPLLDKLNELLSPHTSSDLIDSGVIKCIPVNFVRGLTFHDSLVIIDEFQNLTFEEGVTILTRFGHNSKYIAIGDARQADIGSKSGFKDLFNAFDDTESVENHIHTYRFGENEIVRSKILRFIVGKIERIKKH